MRSSPRFPWLAGLALLMVTTPALADVVLLLPARGQVPGQALSSTLAHETRYVIMEAGHSLVPELDTAAAVRQVEDGVPDNADEFAAMAGPVGAGWVVVPTIRPSGLGYHLELTAYWVKNGRTESVARDINTEEIHQQVLEMARVLLRPQGVGTGALPWESKGPPPPMPSVEGAATTSVTEPEGAGVEPSRSYHLKAGAGLGVSSALVRPDEATGSATAMQGALRAALALGGSFEFGADFRSAFTDPKSASLSVSARAWFDILPERGLRIAPEVAPGLFFMRGGSKDTSFQLRASLVASLDLSSMLALEAQLGELAWVPASSGTVLLGGATLMGIARF